MQQERAWGSDVKALNVSFVDRDLQLSVSSAGKSYRLCFQASLAGLTGIWYLIYGI